MVNPARTRSWASARSNRSSTGRSPEVSAPRLLHITYHREAITSAAALAFRQAVTKVTDELIEPVADEVRWRWKRLFANDGLKLRSDGSIVRTEAGQELG